MPTDPNTNIYRIAFSHPDREFALTFLTRFYTGAEQLLREDETKQVEAQIAYVRAKLEETTIADYRASLVQVLAEQEKKMMALRSGLPYVANYIEPATVSDRPSRPAVLRNLVLGLIAGLVFGVILVLLINVSKSILTRPPSR